MSSQEMSFEERNQIAIADYNRVAKLVSDFFTRYNGIAVEDIDLVEFRQIIDGMLSELMDINRCLQKNEKYFIEEFCRAASGRVHDIKNSVLGLSRLFKGRDEKFFGVVNTMADFANVWNLDETRMKNFFSKGIARLLGDNSRITPIASIQEIVHQRMWVNIGKYAEFDSFFKVIPEDVRVSIAPHTGYSLEVVKSDLAYHLLIGELVTNYRKYGCSGRCEVEFANSGWQLTWTNTCLKEVPQGTYSGKEGFKIMEWCVKRLNGEVLACRQDCDGQFFFRAFMRAPVGD